MDRILAVILSIWEPLSLALFIAPRLSSMSSARWDSAALLLFRLLVAALGIAAGLALWREAPGAPRLAAVALVLATIASAVTLAASSLPSNLPHGDAPFWIALVVAHNGAWLAYLGLRRQS